ncbi:hypothetical protein BJ165DRAFT_1532623 [Panaeolus papilionaceus]|nr:hypothetical protein BJ165DRAFT_1532623 [Panaeolus papilionaceus]
MVDLQRGEQQKNVDYAFVKSLQSMNVDLRQRVTILYDVACQYFVKLRGRIDPMLASGDPDLRDLVIDRAIGLFHVHAHKDQCFFQYSPSFIPGLGTVAGEILESLWAALNNISISLRTASLSYRLETLDDHATDSNHKKILNMANTLIDKLRDARDSADEHQTVFDDIDQWARDQGLTREWEIKIEEAEEKRLETPEVMDIYGADMTKISGASTRRESAPIGIVPGTLDEEVVTYFKAAIELEERQIDLQRQIKQAGKTPTSDEETKIERDRAALLTLINALKNLEIAANVQLKATKVSGSLDILPEAYPLCLPSLKNISGNHGDKEMQIRLQQADLQLDLIWELIVEKSMQYSHIIRNAKSKAITTRSRQKVNNISECLDFHCELYNRACSAMESLGLDKDAMEHYHTLERKHLNSSTALLLPNAKKSTKINLTLSWIWRARVLARTGNLAAGSQVTEPIAVQEFLRVHWLRAQALSRHWKEEFVLLSIEMEWTVRFFLFHSEKWGHRAR